MESAITDDQLDNMLERARQIAEEDGVEFTEEFVRSGVAGANPCGQSYLDMCWQRETTGFRDITDRDSYDAMMTERVVERFRAMPTEA